MPANIVSTNSFSNVNEVSSTSFGKSPVDLLEKSSSITSDKKVAVEKAKTAQEAQDLVAEQKTVITDAELTEAIEVVSAFINQPSHNVNFIQDNDSGRTVIKVFDNSSNELIKQFPSEELVSIAQKIRALHQQVEAQTGILIDTSV